MLGLKKNEISVKIKDNTYKFSLDFRTIKYIVEIFEEDYFTVISRFYGIHNIEYLSNLLYCMCHKKLKKDDIIQYLLASRLTQIDLYMAIYSLIEIENNSEYKKPKKIVKKQQEQQEEETEEYEQLTMMEQFEQWWNKCYYFALVKLNWSEIKFFNSTPRQLQTLIDIDVSMNKDILIGSNIEFENMKAEAQMKAQKETKVKEEKENRVECFSFSEMFGKFAN